MDTCNRSKGYNITTGGDGTCGRACSEETKKKISENTIGIHAGSKHPRAKKIEQYTVNGDFIKTWDCIKDAANELHIKNSDISGCCKGRHYTCGGYRWQYAA